MNIFLPYEDNIPKSTQSLDDKRLNKQILECYQLLKNAIKEINGEEVNGYKNHPIYVHYKDNPLFIGYYGAWACMEYKKRFNKEHKLDNFFGWFAVAHLIKGGKYIPFYMEGSKGQSNYIRTTENVSELYQLKLCSKWDNDKAKGRPPKWTNRETPSFYKGE